MTHFHSILVFCAVARSVVLVAASSDSPVLDSREVQHLLGNSCRESAEIIDGKDGTLEGGEGGTERSYFPEDLGETRVLTSEEPSQTIKTTATVIDQIFGPITARAAQPEPIIPTPVDSILGVAPTTDINSQINSAKSEASVAAAASISQISQSFQSSMQDLQSSASSAISRANASASSAIAEASSSSLQAAAMISSVNDRAQKQISLSQAQSEVTTKVAIAVVISIIGSSFISILGFFLFSRRRTRKQRGENDARRSRHQGDHDYRHRKQRDAYRSHNSRLETRKQSETRPVERTRSPKFHEEFEQRKSLEASEKKDPETAVYEVQGDEEFRDKKASMSTELFWIEQASWPGEHYVARASRRPHDSMDEWKSDETLRGSVIEIPKSPAALYNPDQEGGREKRITSSRNSKNRPSLLGSRWFGNKNRGDSITMDSIGIAS